MEVDFEPKKMTLNELSEAYLPELTDKQHRVKTFIARLLIADIERYLSPIRRGKHLCGNAKLSLQDVWVITRHFGWPPFK